MKADLIKELQVYQPRYRQEEADQRRIINDLQLYDDIYFRKNEIAHMCASAWIINEFCTKALMVYHHIYDSWSWCGGHCDGEEDMIATAYREGLEETGLKELTLVSEHILSIEVLPVKAHIKKGKAILAHEHLNITYLFLARESDSIHHKPDENCAVKWIAFDKIDTYVKEEHMLMIYHKLIERAKRMYNT